MTTCSTTFSKCQTNHLTDPLFLSDTGLNISRTDVVKYPAILKLDEKMRSLFWAPEEIAISKDKADFSDLTLPEQQIFTETLLRATMLDSIQGRSPSSCLLPICTNPELELAISTWDFFETIHSKSYSYIIKNIFPDPSKTFDSLMDISGITDCATSISEYYDTLDRCNAMRTLNLPEYNLYDHKKSLYQTITAINALEAIRFYSAFAVFFNYGENGIMQGNAKILQMISRDESLHVGITTQLLRLLPLEDPDYQQIKEETNSLKIYQDVIHQEIDWVRYIFSKGSILGLNESMLSDYVYYLGRQKIRTFLNTPDDQLGFPVIKSNPLPWMDNWLNTSSMQAAPQEIEQINYQAGILDMTDLSGLAF